MATRAPQQTDELLRLLIEAKLDMIVVGGVAALAYGASTFTRDLDITVPFTTKTLEQLSTLLRPLHPKFAERPDINFFDLSTAELASYRLLLIDTDLGRLDILRQITPIGEYPQIETQEIELLPGKTCKVITLEQLIKAKRHLGRNKDKIVVQELLALHALSQTHAANSEPEKGDEST